MPSPFPGMDPYLEARWSNVHVFMMGAIAAALNGSLPGDLEARPEEEVRIETIAGERLQGFRPDIAIVDLGEASPGPATTGGATAVAEPIRVAYFRGPVVSRNVQVVDARDGDRIVTVIEMLSPWNKLPGDLNRDYRLKLQAMSAADANWVEIDLLRSSRDRLSVTWRDLPADRRTPYLALTYRATEAEVSAYPISLRQRLPTIAVPLRRKDTDVQLDLQAVFDRVYAEGRFGRIDYTRPADPPLSADDAAWLAERLRA